MTDENTYKEPLYICAWLETALKKEWQKYSAIPVTPDAVPGHEEAQGWGYVVAGYFLIEQGLKAVLHLHGVQPPKTHALSVLFAELPEEDQAVLRAYYDDFRHTLPGMASFPMGTVDEFLVNLDGSKDSRGQYIGSFDWRYFLTEKGSGASMPLVSINVMHEIVYGCVQLVSFIEKGTEEAGRANHSWRLRLERRRLQEYWLMVREESPGWDQESDRLEILWGPDYRDRYDYLVFEGGQRRDCFAPLPDIELSIVDKRDELASFDLEEGLRSIGVMSGFPPRPQDTPSHHVMY